jgi:hypothetical protein
VECSTGAGLDCAARDAEVDRGFSMAMTAGFGLKVTFLFVFLWASELVARDADADGSNGELSILAAEEAMENQWATGLPSEGQCMIKNSSEPAIWCR